MRRPSAQDKSPRRRPHLLAFATACLLMICVPLSVVHAQGGPVDIQQYKPAMDSKGHFTIDSTQVLGPWNVSIGLLGAYAYRPLELKGDQLSNGRRPGYRIDHMVGAWVQFALGMFKLSKRGKPWFEIGFGVPINYVLSKLQNPDDVYFFNQGQGGCGAAIGCTVWEQDASGGAYPMGYGQEGNATGQGVGDAYLHLKFRFLDTSTSPVGLGAMLSFTFPSSKAGNGHNKFIGTGGFGIWPKLILDKAWRKQGVLLSLNVGARLRFGTSGELKENPGWSLCQATEVLSSNPNERRPIQNPCPDAVDPTESSFDSSKPDNGFTRRVSILYEITYGVGLSVELSKAVTFTTELYGSVELSSLGKGDQPASVPWAAGIQAKYHKKVFPVELLLGFKFYLGQSSFLAIGGGIGLTGIAGLDHAGSPDARFFFSIVFEPTVGDRDGDGIKDDVDKCPDQPEDFDDFEDKDGCPDPDNDGDGIPDTDDKCPNTPENYNGFEDEDGCPDKKDEDRDGDGIPDSQDKCPDVPEDKDDFEDTDGCPDPDNDGDGITDKDDKCPGKDGDKKNNFKDVKEDIDGFEDTDGCPDIDNDKDGILDKDDKCPNEPETRNNYKDDDGCPDKNPITITKDKVLILEKIYFETNKAKIKQVSFPLLNTVAATLRKAQELKLIEIQGHTDERGSRRYNLNLSQRRADAVRNYLINKGVKRARLKGQGYGEDRPKCRRSTTECWSRNRRVEFIIVKRSL